MGTNNNSPMNIRNKQESVDEISEINKRDFETIPDTKNSSSTLDEAVSSTKKSTLSEDSSDTNFRNDRQVASESARTSCSTSTNDINKTIHNETSTSTTNNENSTN